MPASGSADAPGIPGGVIPEVPCGPGMAGRAGVVPGGSGQQVLPLIDYLARVARRAYDCQGPGCLRPRHLIALGVLRERGPLGQRALGEALSLDASNVVGLLNELEERGLVARQRDPADRRRHIVSLSAQGARELEASGDQVTGVERDLLKALDPGERAQLRDLLARVADSTLSGSCAQSFDAGGAPAAAAPAGLPRCR